MITKKKLREELILICAGAGMDWVEDGYFEVDGCRQFYAVGLVIMACEFVYHISEKSRLTQPYNLGKFDDIDTMVQLVHSAIEFNGSETRN